MRKYLCISIYCRIFASEKETNNKLNPKTRKGTEIMKTTANTTSNISAYKIYWAEFTPVTGKLVTKKDIATIQGYADRYIGRYNKNYRKHFASKERALEFINNFNKKL